MHMVAPRTGAEEVTIAENQLEYRPLTVAVYRRPADDPDYPNVPCLLSRWRFTDAERQRITDGEDLYIEHLGAQLQPLAPQVGPDGYLVEVR